VAACTAGIFDAPLYISTDFGATWTKASTGNWVWKAVACSADGVNMYALEDGWFFYSRNSGSTWYSVSPGARDWWDLTCSADGTKLIASLRFGGIFTSTNSGLNWSTNNTAPAGLMWPVLASSADGNNLLAAGAGSIYTSTNAGAVWVSNSAPFLSWIAVACSADGNKLIASSDTRAAPIYVAQPKPDLNIQSISNQVLVSWPSSATGFTLQQNTNLTTTNWSTVTDGVVSGINQVTLTPIADKTFYRLKYP
jgi:hypothetical protein